MLDGDPAKVRGGLFHAAISDPAGIVRRKPLLRSMFDTIDANKSGAIDRAELQQFVAWAASSPSALPMHRRVCALFLEGGSLERSFDKFVVLLPPAALLSVSFAVLLLCARLQLCCVVVRLCGLL